MPSVAQDAFFQLVKFTADHPFLAFAGAGAAVAWCTRRFRPEEEAAAAAEGSKGTATVTWEPNIAQRIAAGSAAKAMSGSKTPFMVAISGVPGSGKTTSTKILADLLPGSLAVPFDGFHHYSKELLAMPDPEEKVYWRGAPHTFDAARYRKKLLEIVTGDAPTVELPAFDHATADPEQGAVVFRRDEHPIVIVEGIYTLLNDGEWEGLPDMYDMRIFVSSDLEKCIERIKIRNRCIPGYTADEMDRRCDTVDRGNAIKIIAASGNAEIFVMSVAS